MTLADIFNVLRQPRNSTLVLSLTYFWLSTEVLVVADTRSGETLLGIHAKNLTFVLYSSRPFRGKVARVLLWKIYSGEKWFPVFVQPPSRYSHSVTFCVDFRMCGSRFIWSQNDMQNACRTDSLVGQVTLSESWHDYCLRKMNAQCKRGDTVLYRTTKGWCMN